MAVSRDGLIGSLGFLNEFSSASAASLGRLEDREGYQACGQCGLYYLSSPFSTVLREQIELQGGLEAAVTPGASQGPEYTEKL